MKHINNIVLSLFLSVGLYTISYAQCDFEITLNLVDTALYVEPIPDIASRDEIISFLGNNFENQEISNGFILFNLVNPPSESEVFGVYNILCGDVGCDYEVTLETGEFGEGIFTSFLTVLPFLTQEQIDAIGAQYPIAVVDQFSIGGTFIRFENVLPDGAEAEIREIIESFCPDPIPTIGEWGLIALGFLLMIVGVVAVRSRRSTLA